MSPVVELLLLAMLLAICRARVPSPSPLSNAVVGITEHQAPGPSRFGVVRPQWSLSQVGTYAATGSCMQVSYRPKILCQRQTSAKSNKKQ